ncbi:MAG: SUMF1/EgtB/PvdO family nonheme iron enzyme [Candidatus Binatia bacterium]
MPTSVRKFRIFVASPGDVARERQVAREVILSLSGRLGSHGGFVLDPVGWETHASVDAGRPQSLINPLVRESDVFVGVLWSRFGTQTEVAESGTAEEFDEAMRVREQTGDRPTMMVFFSDAPVSMERLRDAEGRQQFDKAREFRDRYEKSGLAERYKDVHEFERKLREQLESWCGARFAAAPVVPPDADTAGLHREYLQLLFTFHKDLPVAGFETNLRIPIDLESVFVPLRARIAALDRERAPDLRVEHAELQPAEGARDFAWGWQFAAQRDIRLLVVLGQPGSGKTTLLKHLALVCASGKAGELGLTGDTVPIVVPLRQLKTEGDFAPALLAASEPALRGYPPNFFAPALADGRCLLLLDGLDEVVDREEREKVSRWIEELAARYPRNRIVVTARFAGYRDARLRMGHLELSIERFGRDEIESFLRRWYRAVQAQLYGDSPESAQRAEELAAGLIKAILDHDEIRVLAANPLMLQIIALVHRDRGALPKRRVELYEECTNVLLEHWDRARGIETLLSAREARQVLQPVALWMHSETNRIHASQDEVLRIIKDQVARLSRPLDAEAFLRSVRDRSGLLTGHGVDEYGFQHLSFQEYLAAEEIRNTRQFEVLVQHYDESWWREVTRLFVGLGNPNYFDDFMRGVAGAGKLAGHESFTAECIRDALLPSAQPFVEAATAKPGFADRIRRSLGRDSGVMRRYAALQALRALPPLELARVAQGLSAAVRDPDAAVRRIARELLVASRSYGPEALDEGVDPASGLPRIRINAGDGTELVLVPGGEFMCGEPARRETLQSFYLARYPVTNTQYAEFLKATPKAAKPEYWEDERFNQPQQPVVGVSWEEARTYCEWAGLRLPTEWEWEKGARGTDGRTYPWGEDDPDPSRAVFGDPGGQPAPAGSCPAGASPYGLMDMAGNVWEWTASLYKKGKDWCTVRGGSFFNGAQFLRAAIRYFNRPATRFRYVGFRCARDP